MQIIYSATYRGVETRVTHYADDSSHPWAVSFWGEEGLRERVWFGNERNALRFAHQAFAGALGLPVPRVDPADHCAECGSTLVDSYGTHETCADCREAERLGLTRDEYMSGAY